MSRPDGEIDRNRTLSLLRVARLETNWGSYSRGEYGRVQWTAMDRDLQMIREGAVASGLGRVCDVCEGIGRVLAFAKAHGFAVPQELDILMTMAIQFLGMLVRGGDDASKASKLDAFLREVESALADASGAPTDISVPRSAPRSARELDGGRRTSSSGSIKVATRAVVDLAGAATTVFLAHLAAEGASRERLRTVWSTLLGEAAGNRVPGGAGPSPGRLTIRMFRAPFMPVDVAVLQDWAVEIETLPSSRSRSVDLLSLCFGGAAVVDDAWRAEPVVLRIRRGSQEFYVLAGSSPTPVTADRVCPTAETAGAEVVLVRGAEVVLLRPDRLLGPQTS